MTESFDDLDFKDCYNLIKQLYEEVNKIIEQERKCLNQGLKTFNSIYKDANENVKRIDKIFLNANEKMKECLYLATKEKRYQPENYLESSNDSEILLKEALDCMINVNIYFFIACMIFQ